MRETGDYRARDRDGAQALTEAVRESDQKRQAGVSQARRGVEIYQRGHRPAQALLQEQRLREDRPAHFKRRNLSGRRTGSGGGTDARMLTHGNRFAVRSVVMVRLPRIRVAVTTVECCVSRMLGSMRRRMQAKDRTEHGHRANQEPEDRPRTHLREFIDGVGIVKLGAAAGKSSLTPVQTAGYTHPFAE